MDFSAESREPKPTIVLVHGAFANASGWGAVIDQRRKDGYNVIAVQNTLTSLVAVNDVLEPDMLSRRMLGRLTPSLLLFRSDDTYVPARLPVVNARSSESGSPVRSA